MHKTPAAIPRADECGTAPGGQYPVDPNLVVVVVVGDYVLLTAGPAVGKRGPGDQHGGDHREQRRQYRVPDPSGPPAAPPMSDFLPEHAETPPRMLSRPDSVPSRVQRRERAGRCQVICLTFCAHQGWHATFHVHTG